MPVAGGEQDSSLPQFQWMLDKWVVDIVQPDMMYNGGMHAQPAGRQWAAQHEFPLCPTVLKSGAEAAAVLHFASIVPNLGPHQEYHGEYFPRCILVHTEI